MINRKNGLPEAPYWVSGAFMCIQAKLYHNINGFNEAYYMYCEDIDLSRRLLLKKVKPEFLENVKAVHYRRRNSKRLLSRYFYWHVKSVFIYCFGTKQVSTVNSCLNSNDIELKR